MRVTFLLFFVWSTKLIFRARPKPIRTLLIFKKCLLCGLKFEKIRNLNTFSKSGLRMAYEGTKREMTLRGARGQIPKELGVDSVGCTQKSPSPHFFKKGSVK